jgi:hypothetical protein
LDTPLSAMKNTVPPTTALEGYVSTLTVYALFILLQEKNTSLRHPSPRCLRNLFIKKQESVKQLAVFFVFFEFFFIIFAFYTENILLNF